MTKPSDTPDSSLIREQNAALREENKALKEEVEQLKQHNYTLRLKVDAMARKLFGKSSEKLDADQLQLVFDALRDEPPQEAKKPDASDLAESDSEAASGAQHPPGTRRRAHAPSRAGRGYNRHCTRASGPTRYQPWSGPSARRYGNFR